MTNIKIDDNYRIISDERCYVLQRYKGIDKKGDKLYESLCYYEDIDGCVKNYIQFKTKSKDIKTLKQFLEELKKEEKYVEEMLSCLKV